MSSLQKLLSDEGFERSKFPKHSKYTKPKDRILSDDSIALPIYICRDRKSFNVPKNKSSKTSFRNGSSIFSSKKASSVTDSENTIPKACKDTDDPRRNEPAIDEVATRAVISILSGYIGSYLKDENFRGIIREKCYSCLERKNEDYGDSDNEVFAKIELGIESIEKLVDSHGTRKEIQMKTLHNSIHLLTIVSSLNSQNAKNGSTCGTPNSHLSACAQLYLAIVYKLENNDRISARHLLQVFCDSPFLARTHLLPHLWEHFFLPHLLHIKIWYTKEYEFLMNSDSDEKEKKIKALTKVYNDQMDMGTTQFALYYKEWLKVGGNAPPVPSVPSPSKPNYSTSRRRSSNSFSSPSSINKKLYQAVFGTSRRSMDFDDREGDLIDTWGLDEGEEVFVDEVNFTPSFCAYKGRGSHQRSSFGCRSPKNKLWPESQKSEHFMFFNCQSEPKECLVQGKNNHIAKNVTIVCSDLDRAITTISSSDCLSDCELAVRLVTQKWLDSQGDPTVEAALSRATLIEGMLEILFASNDDEILELAISLLAELVSRNEFNRQIILNSDPQLEIFLRLLRNSSLFLKAAALLYLVKPEAKQMISIEWVPLVLRVLEFGDLMQTLFTVRCSPQVAAFYFMKKLLTGFNEDRNLENARQVVAFRGLSLLVKRIDKGEMQERNDAASIINLCLRGDGSCRYFLANNVNKASLLELLVLGKQRISRSCAFTLLIELLCLSRRTQITKFLKGLKHGWDGMNAMHILLAYLQIAPPEERPLVAAVLLQLDLLGDPLKNSVYREEVVDTIIASLDCQICNEEVQEQCARALLVLGGRFSYTGEASTEMWLLRQAGFDESSGDSFYGKEIVVDKNTCMNEEEEAIKSWQSKTALMLLKSGNRRFLEALSESMANGIPILSRASLVTIAWMSVYLCSMEDDSFGSMTCSVFAPQLLLSLRYNRAVEERFLASFSLLNLVRCRECVVMIKGLEKELMGPLQNLSLVSWTANEIISILTNASQGTTL